MKTLRIYADRVSFGRAVNLSLTKPLDPTDPHGRCRYATLTWQSEAADEDLEQEPTVSMRLEDAQELLQALWNVGLRPLKPDADLVVDVQAHLQDMRAIAFSALGEKFTKP